MALELHLPMPAFQGLSRIALYMGEGADKAVTQALYVAWTLYYMGNSRNAAKIIIPNLAAPSKRKQIKTGTRIALPLRPKLGDDADRSPLRVAVAPDANECIEALAQYLHLSPEETVWHALQLVADVVEAMETHNTDQLWAVLPFGFTIKGTLLEPPR